MYLYRGEAILCSLEGTTKVKIKCREMQRDGLQ